MINEAIRPSTALAKVDAAALDIISIATHLAKSGYFQDARDASQAVVKVLAGQELGVGPIAAMTGIYIVKGRVTLSANLMASLVKRSGRYDYRVREVTDTQCRIEFFEQGETLGESAFTAADAKRAGLGGDNWRNYPRNMLFSRAMSNGVKWYCPEVTNGPSYTPEEMGAIIDGATGEIIEPAQPRVVHPERNRVYQDAAAAETNTPAPPAQPAPRVSHKAALAEKVRQGIADGSIQVPGQVIVTTTSERSPLDQLRHEVVSLILEAEELGATFGPDQYGINSAAEDQLILWREELSASIDKQRAYNAKRVDLQNRWDQLQAAGAECGVEVPEWDDEMSNEESVIEGKKWQDAVNKRLRENGATDPAPAPDPNLCAECRTPLTIGQREVSTRAYGRPLCPTHQKSQQ